MLGPHLRVRLSKRARVRMTENGRGGGGGGRKSSLRGFSRGGNKHGQRKEKEGEGEEEEEINDTTVDGSRCLGVS